MAKVFIKNEKGETTSFIDTSKALGKWKATVTCQGAEHSMVKMKSGWFTIRHMPAPYQDAAFEVKPAEVVKWFFEYGHRANLPKEAQDMLTEIE
jgi:hypothetical protein